MKKRHLFVAVAIIMAALVFFTCDLIAPVDCPDDNQDADGPLIINGLDEKNDYVIITFRRPAQTALAVQKAAALSPREGDTYDIIYNGDIVSSGSIKVNGSIITFIPIQSGVVTFTGTYSNGILSFSSDPIPGTNIKGFRIDNGSNGGSSEANAIARAWGTNATASANTVFINGNITVLNSITISDNITLVFDARDNNSFTIGTGNSSNSNAGTRVTVRGGIVVSEGRGVTLQGPAGTLVVEGLETSGSASTINGKLIVGEGTTLDIAGDATIAAGGVLELMGYETAYNVAVEKYKNEPPTNDILLIPGRKDAKFKLRGKMSVENGGRFQMPDPYLFDVTGIAGSIEVKPGGELILATSDPKGNFDLHPWIGTDYTATQGAPVGADFVMDPRIDGKIVVRISGGDTPVLELSGSATALGRLILDENHVIHDLDGRKPPYRFEVWLTYPFTVTTGGILTVGNSEAVNLRSTILVTGEDFSKINTTANSGGSSHSTYHTNGIYGIQKGINKGVLTNNYRIKVWGKNAIVQWFGGYFNNINGKIYDKDMSNEIPEFYPLSYIASSSTTDTPMPSASASTSLTFKPYDDFLEYKLWSPEWIKGPPPDSTSWTPWNPQPEN